MFPEPVDPRLIPLPSSSDPDLTHGPTIARSLGHSPTKKVAGSRHTKQPSAEFPATSNKAKGKRKRDAGSDLDDLSDLSEPLAKRHGGR